MSQLSFFDDNESLLFPENLLEYYPHFLEGAAQVFAETWQRILAHHERKSATGLGTSYTKVSKAFTTAYQFNVQDYLLNSCIIFTGRPGTYWRSPGFPGKKWVW